MRSQSFLRKSHLLLKRSTVVHPIQSFSVSSSLSLKQKQLISPKHGLLTKRLLSTPAAPPPIGPEESSPDALDPSESSTTEEPTKTTSRTRRYRVNGSSTNGSSPTKDADPVELPLSFENDILYVPTQTLLDTRPGGLPPPEIFEEALDNLLITLHPQNQDRSLVAPAGSSKPIEPTLGLYCPIEGGDYILDLTVHELAYQTGAEVLILDAVQLAAGEWGPFGKAASAFNLPNNPLHFSAPPTSSSELSTDRDSSEKPEEEESIFAVTPPSGRMSVTLPKGLSPFAGRSIISQISRKPTQSKLDVFFETLINLPISKAANASNSDNEPRPRLIYIRDFPTLSRSSSLWYPSLLAAVKQRRRAHLTMAGGISSPVTIIFGMTPPITPPVNENSSAAPSNNLMSLLMNRNASGSQISSSRKHEHQGDWSEGEVADAAREKRLRSRLRKWEKSSAGIHDEFPSLSLKSEDSEGGGSSGPNIIVIGGSEPSSGPGFGFGVVEPSSENSSQFFRSTILVPRTRSITDERETRIARRREINELTMRMGVGAVGGLVESSPASTTLASSVDPPAEDTSSTPISTAKHLWEDWGNKIEIWPNVRKVADRAIGSVMVSQKALIATPVLDPTVVPWSAVQKAWTSYQTMIDARKSWLKEVIGHLPISDESGEGKDDLVNAGSVADKVVEAVKNDPELDQHESRLLSCIVDSVSINTTFSQVHLQPHTIDAVRTIVSLPLLHPQAFQQGILKEHSMTGCLLFGPPGTGKTLVVRALAKEAGCRMLAISPSDVMDMYVGEGEKLVKAVFSLARRLSPCVVFLDEIDALFGARMSARESGSAFAHRGVITEFMQEMDGLKSSKDDNVIVIGATNRPFDLDDAVLRRLPRRLLVDLPGEKERQGILRILLRDENMADDVNIETLAKKTDGFSGSDLKHLCVSAALDSVKEHTSLPWASRHVIDAPVTQSETQVPAIDGLTPAPDAVSTTDASEIINNDNDVLSLASNIAPENTTTISVDESVSPKPPASDGSIPASVDELTSPKVPEVQATPRILRLQNFTQALKEITPSSSETLGSLADLRKWNEEFGEGRRDRKKRQVWGKGRFGFVNNHTNITEQGKVTKEQPNLSEL